MFTCFFRTIIIMFHYISNSKLLLYIFYNLLFLNVGILCRYFDFVLPIQALPLLLTPYIPVSDSLTLIDFDFNCSLITRILASGIILETYLSNKCFSSELYCTPVFLFYGLFLVTYLKFPFITVSR